MSTNPFVLPSKIRPAILGILLIATGYYSYFGNDIDLSEQFPEDENSQPCDVDGSGCPKRIFDYLFIAAITATYVFVLATLGLQLALKEDSDRFKAIDIRLHIISAILILISGILYLTNVTKLYKLKPSGTPKPFKMAFSYLACGMCLGQSALLIFTVIHLLGIKCCEGIHCRAGTSRKR